MLSRILTRHPETRHGVAGIKRSAWFAAYGYREEHEDEELDTLERRRGVEAAFDETDLEDLESAEIDPDPDPNRRISAGVPLTPSAHRSASDPRPSPAAPHLSPSPDPSRFAEEHERFRADHDVRRPRPNAHVRHGRGEE